jgi:beta-glucosidase
VSDPAPFLWGATSSSVGTEGAASTSDWAAWERTGRAPPSNDGNGWRTNFRDDIPLLASLGFGALRITIEWARLEPAAGRVDAARVEHERSVLEAIRDNGLHPWVTLHNGSLPGWFADDEGGFRDERARGYFWPRHVDRCGEWFGDLVAGWTPIEDPVGWALRGYLRGVRPPGRRDPENARDAVVGALDANLAAWKVLRGGGAPVMSVLGLPTVNARDADARAEASRWQRLLWQLPLRARREGVLEIPGGAEVERPDMAGAFDLIGIAYDHPIAVGADGSAGPFPPTARLDDTGFAPNATELGDVLRRVAEDAPDTPLVVAANGVATTDDSWREELLRDTFTVLDDARHDGVDLRGYFLDTAIDGYEWNHGFAAHRGIVTRERSLKPSARWLQERLS